MKCREHGRTLTTYKSQSRNKEWHHYYLCTKPQCQRFRVDWAHDQIKKLLDKITFTAGMIKVYRSQLVEYYKSVDGKTKNKILGCIFSEKLVIEHGEVANIKFTKPIQLLLNASKGLKKSENKKEVENDLFLNLVDNSFEISNISFTPRDLIDMFNLLPNFLQNHL